MEKEGRDFQKTGERDTESGKTDKSISDMEAMRLPRAVLTHVVATSTCGYWALEKQVLPMQNAHQILKVLYTKNYKVSH